MPDSYNGETVLVFLSGRMGAYQIFQNLLGNEPDKLVLNQIANKASQEVLSLFAPEDGAPYDHALGMFNAALLEVTSNPIQFERIQNGFTRLFVGPGKVEVDPWESVYLRKDAVLFQPSTLEVRKAYVAQGFIPQNYPHVADDHIALELDFMAQLAARATKDYSMDSSASSLRVLEASETFLREHLLVWVPRFVQALKQAKHAAFYRETGELLGEFLRIDHQALKETIEELRKTG
jgi:TorA maturation chaperone TorD